MREKLTDYEKIEKLERKEKFYWTMAGIFLGIVIFLKVLLLIAYIVTGGVK